jgi:acylphosphatase
MAEKQQISEYVKNLRDTLVEVILWPEQTSRRRK